MLVIKANGPVKEIEVLPITLKARVSQETLVVGASSSLSDLVRKSSRLDQSWHHCQDLVTSKLGLLCLSQDLTQLLKSRHRK